jgi:glycerophosphoryl diester phosphodiesterase
MVIGQLPSLQTRFIVAVSTIFAITLTVFSLACTKPAPMIDPPPRLIAHSAGIGNHRTYTNSLEALDNSVARGHTVIEVDLSWTYDRHLVLIHDWGYEFEKLFDRSPGRLTLAEFRSLPSAYGLSHLSFQDLAGWLLGNPDVLIITDIKKRKIEGLRLIAEEYPQLLHRIIPQVFQPDTYFEVTKLGYDRVILSLYRTELSDRQIVDFAAENPLYGVTIPARRAMEGTLPKELAANGVRVYSHTVNDYPTVNALQSKGVYGVYTDWLTPGDDQNSRPLAEWWVKSEGEVALEGLVVPFLPWEMAGLKTTIDLHNTGGTLETVRLNVLDSSGRSIATDEFEILGNDTHQVILEKLVSPRKGHGWLRIEAADKITVRPRWYFLGGLEGAWASERVAIGRFETGGSGFGLGGVLVAVVNPTDSIQSYHLRRLIGGNLIDDDGVDLEPGHQLLRVYRSQTNEELRLTVTGGPMVTQVLRWDPMGRFMR